MHAIGWTPPLVPLGADQTVYVIVDSCALGCGRHNIEIEMPDLETIICDLMSGRFSDPVRVVAFNTLEHWSEDLSQEVAGEIQVRSDINGMPVPDHLSDFVERHCAHAVSVAA